MLHYQIERTDDQLLMVINRRTSAVSKVYVGMIAAFSYLGYAVIAVSRSVDDCAMHTLWPSNERSHRMKPRSWTRLIW